MSLGPGYWGVAQNFQRSNSRKCPPPKRINDNILVISKSPRRRHTNSGEGVKMDYRAELARSSLNRKPSQETLMSLLHLDPAPMDNASIYEKELPDLPEEDLESSRSSLRSRNTSSSSTTLGLSGTANGPLYYCTFFVRSCRTPVQLTVFGADANTGGNPTRINSNPHTTLLFLYFWLLRRPACCQHLGLPARLPLRPVLRTVSPHGP